MPSRPASCADVLEKLIEQQLAVDQAIESSTARPTSCPPSKPPTAKSSPAPTPGRSPPARPKTTEEARDYYTKTRALFAERRIYNIQEIVVPEAAGLAAPLRDMIAAGKRWKRSPKWLRARTSSSAATPPRAAEQIPLELLPKVAALKDGQGLVLENGGGLAVMRLVASAVPAGRRRTGPAAHPDVPRQPACREAAAKEMKALREKAKISYVGGEFAEGANPPPPRPRPPLPPSRTGGTGQRRCRALEKASRASIEMLKQLNRHSGDRRNPVR